MNRKAVSGIMLALFLASILIIWTQSVAAPPPLGMISYWRLNEGSGTTAYDSVGDNDGTLVNGPVWTTGIVDGALSFDGIDDYVVISHHNDLNIGGNGKGFTAEAWIKTPNPNPSQQIIRKGGVDAIRYEFKTWESGTLLRFICYPYGTSYSVHVDATITADDGNWHHVAATKSASDNLLRIYFDGELAGTSTSTCPGTEASTAPLWIGTELNPEPNAYWFKGTIDEVAIYNRALALEEIQQHYENGLMGLGYYVEEIPATVDIDPNTLNLRSKGKWITCYIELPEGYDVNDINVSTVMLNETFPAELHPTEIGDYDGDDIPHLMVKFDRAEVTSYILDNVDMTELFERRFMTITLTITGYLDDGPPFESSETIRISMPMRGRSWRFLETLEIFTI